MGAGGKSYTGMSEPVVFESLRWVVGLPLLGAAINGLCGAWLQRAFGKRAISLVACTPVVIAFLLSVQVMLRLVALPVEQRALIDRLWTWIDIGGLRAEVAFVAISADFFVL